MLLPLQTYTTTVKYTYCTAYGTVPVDDNVR